VSREDVQRWLDGYVEAWETYDRDRIAELFSEDAEYRYHPYSATVSGRNAIVESWLEDRDPPGTWHARYEPIAVDGDVAVAVGTSRYLRDDGSVDRIFHNAFVMRFAADGRCSEFTEWYMKQPLSALRDAE
jgi:ketosteroid isomerase-like protein